MNSDGSAIRQVSDIPGGISEFKLSPDQTKVMYVSNVKYATKPTDLYPDLDKSSGREINDLMYRHWDCFVEEIPHTFVSDVVAANGNLSVKPGKDIIEGTMYELPTLPLSGIEQLSWSPDGKYIAYACRKVTGKEYAFSTDTDIYLYDVEKGTCEDLTDGMNGYDTDPVFSPDGKYIAWISMERAGFEADKQRLFIIDVATRVKKELSVNYKYNVTNPVWKSTSDGIYFCSLVNALQGIFVSDLTGNITRITPDDCWYDFEGVIELGEKLLTCNHSMSRPNEIVEISLADGSFKQITHENDDILAQLKQETYEQRWITTTDGKKMHTWVVFPPDFDPAKQYPAMLFCTGGPQGTLSQGWSTRWSYKLMAANGYIVVLPNRRGTTAFGQEWCDQISGDYPGQNMKDYMAAAKNIKAEPYVGKIGASGASYGGYSIYNLAGTHEGFFDAFLSHAGIFNQEQMYMMTEELWFPTWDNGGAPWDNNPVAKRHYAESPHKKVTKWDTPIMVTHGEMDYRVPVEQGMAAFNAAQMMGVPSRMLLFPEENHWILRPQNAVHWQRSFFDWFDKWLK
jgi:dipeptidyl aminopeptidase/acylaminoacyl peptidase